MRITFPRGDPEDYDDAEERKERKERKKIVEDYWGESDADW